MSGGDEVDLCMLVVMDRRGHGVWVDAMTRLGESEHHTAWNMSMMDVSTDTVAGITASYDE